MQNSSTYTSSSKPHPWEYGSRTEIGQIERLKRACAGIDRYWEIECGRSDEGDPWCAVYDWGRDRPVLHVAHIDDLYEVICPSPLRTFSAATLSAAIDAALAELKNDEAARGDFSNPVRGAVNWRAHKSVVRPVAKGSLRTD